MTALKSVSEKSYFFAALAILLVLAIWRATINDAITGDVAMYLQCGELLLRGQTIYVDFFDLNPPLVFFISVIPAALARLMSLPLLLAGSVTCSAFAIVSLCVTAYILRCSIRGSAGADGLIGSASAGGPIDAACAGALLLAMATLSAFTTYDFGQREHILVLAWLPYLLLRWARLNGVVFNRPLIALVSFLAGLMICFKPYFLLCPLFLELVLWSRRGQAPYLFVAELAALSAGGAAYAAALLLMPSLARQYLFNYLAPLLSAGYSAFDQHAALVMFSSVWYPTLTLVAISLIFFAIASMGKTNQFPKPLKTLAWAAFFQIICGLILVQVQHKGWCYHGIPMMAAALILLAISFAQLTARMQAVSRLVLALLVTCAGVLASSLWLAGVHTRLHAEWEVLVPQLVPRGSRVAYLDTTDTPWFVRMAAADLWPGSRYLWMFPVPIYQSLLQSGKVDQAHVDKEMTNLMQCLGEDLEKGQAPLVVVRTTGCFALPNDFDLKAYLERYGLLAALRHYDLVHSSEHYRFFKRLPD
ncbi:MAG: hypothetical protein KGS72_07995 [Cyanobacteria bacterium REEB67]|nr:hypothetical protein [Cyanobacteria bacterium REEB67]